MRFNNKGYMLVEIVLAFAITFLFIYFAFDVILKVKEKNDDALVETLVKTDSSIVSNKIMEKINRDSLKFDCSRISIDTDGKTIKYGDEVLNVFNDYANIKKESLKCEDDGKGTHKIYLAIEVPQLPDKNFDISLDYYYNIKDDKTLFEDVGYFGFASVGSNNVSRGDNYRNAEDTCTFIMIPPSGEWYNNILKESGLGRVNNITGSYLDTQGGTIKKAIFSFMVHDPNGKKYNGKILLIKPDHSYKFIPYREQVPKNNAGFVDITDYIDKDNPDGWYYVSFIDVPLTPQTAWGMTVLYENKNTLPYSYTRLVWDNKSLTNGKSYDLMFNNRYPLLGNYQLTGTILAGGVAGWATLPSVSGDKVEAILNDGTLKQLYQTTYKGKTIFSGRSSEDFANGTFNTQKNHNIRGGELDIFDERIGSDFFSGKSISGIRVTKTGSNTIYVGLFGVAMEIDNNG